MNGRMSKQIRREVFEEYFGEEIKNIPNADVREATKDIKDMLRTAKFDYKRTQVFVKHKSSKRQQRNSSEKTVVELKLKPKRKPLSLSLSIKVYNERKHRADVEAELKRKAKRWPHGGFI